MKTIIIIASIAFTITYLNYQVETKDKSLKGYIEYMKIKYWNKRQ